MIEGEVDGRVEVVVEAEAAGQVRQVVVEEEEAAEAGISLVVSRW